MAKIKVAVIGLGRVGSGYDAHESRDFPRSHVGTVLRDPALELSAVCDSNAEARDRFRQDYAVSARVHDSAAALLAAEPYDIVAVAATTAFHAEILTACLAARPKAVFCEKPLCADATAAAVIATRYEAAGIPLVVNYHRRWDRRIATLRRALGDAGSVRAAQLLYVKGLRNYGAHAIDLLQSFFGPVVSVEARPYPAGSGDDPSLSAELIFGDGLRASLVGLDDLPYEVFDLDILTESARFRVEFGGQSIRRQIAEPGRFFPGYTSLSEEARLTPDAPVHGLAEAYRELAAWVAEGRVPTTSTAANAVSVQRVLDAIVASATNGKAVTP